MCNNFSSSGNLVVFLIGHLGHILCMGHIFLISTRHHLSHSLNYSQKKPQPKPLYSLSLKVFIYLSNLWTQKPSRLYCSRSQKALVKQRGGNTAAVRNIQLLPWLSEDQSEMLYWREAPARRKVWCQPRVVSRSKWDTRTLLLQNTLVACACACSFPDEPLEHKRIKAHSVFLGSKSDCTRENSRELEQSSG